MSITKRPPILIAEDNDQDFEVIAEVIDEIGSFYPVRRVVTGEQCLELLERTEPLRPAFLLLDLNMPGLDGRDVLQAIRESTKLPRFPVIVFSTSSSPKDLGICYASGANSYHLKPVEALKFRQIVRTIISYWGEAVLLPQDDADYIHA